MTETSCPGETHSAHLCPAPPHPGTVRKIASDRARNRYKESHFFVNYNGTTRSYRPTKQSSLRRDFIVLFCFHEQFFTMIFRKCCSWLYITSLSRQKEAEKYFKTSLWRGLDA